jgi:hypothetical protein
MASIFSNSKDALKLANNAYAQSYHALKAELTLTPFYSATDHLKMLSTIISHFCRCVVNLAFAFFRLFNTVFNAFKEKEHGQALERGLHTMGFHIAAAGLDFINIFATFGAIIARTVVTLKTGYASPEAPSEPASNGFLDRTTNYVKHTVNKVRRSCTEEARNADAQYKVASALKFS